MSINEDEQKSMEFMSARQISVRNFPFLTGTGFSRDVTGTRSTGTFPSGTGGERDIKHGTGFQTRGRDRNGKYDGYSVAKVRKFDINKNIILSHIFEIAILVYRKCYGRQHCPRPPFGTCRPYILDNTAIEGAIREFEKSHKNSTGMEQHSLDGM